MSNQNSGKIFVKFHLSKVRNESLSEIASNPDQGIRKKIFRFNY
jgi:hypothetical protein